MTATATDEKNRTTRRIRPCRTVALLALAMLLQACEITAPRRSSLLQTTTGGQCVNLGARAVAGAAAPDDAAGSVAAPTTATTSVETAMASAPTGAADAVTMSTGLSPAAAEIAMIIGADTLLEKMATLDAQARRTGSAADAIAVLRLEQQVTHRVLRTMLDVSAVTAHLDCENERGDQLRDQLRKLEDQWSRRMSQSSAIIGGMTAFVSGVVGLVSPAAATSAVTGIVGGTAESGTALISQSGTARGHLDTEPSALRELWEGPPRARLFPASVWRYLNQPAQAGGGQTRRETLLTRWRMRAGTEEGKTVSAVSERQLSLLFGPGGYYTVDDLAARDALIDVVEASIAVMNERLQRLLDELLERSEWPGDR
ncbi:MAG: hypothetical protein QM766_05355 [Burkholderiaceae bacterium]